MKLLRRSRGFSVLKWVNRVKKEKALVQLVVVCALLLVACVLLSMFHVHRIFSAFEQNSYDSIINRSDLTSKYFSDNFQRKGALVKAEAQVLEEDDDIDKTTKFSDIFIQFEQLLFCRVQLSFCHISAGFILQRSPRHDHSSDPSSFSPPPAI